MTPRAIALLEGLRARGFSLALVGDRVRIEFDADALPPTLIAEVRALKPELVQSLQLEEQLLQRIALAIDPGGATRSRTLPSDVLRAVSIVMTRFGGEIVAVTREEASVEKPAEDAGDAR